MAQPVHCDIAGQDPHLADVLVSQIANGDTTAWCFTHYVDVCQAVLDTARETAAQAATADQEALGRLEGSQPGPGAGLDPDTAHDAAAGEAEAFLAGDSPDRPAGDQLPPEGLGESQPSDQEGAEAATAGA